MQFTDIQLVCIGIATLMILCLSYQWLKALLQIDREKYNRKRLGQLSQTDHRKKTDDEINQQFIQQVTEPVIQYVLPRLKPHNHQTIARDLKLIGWSRLMTPEQHVAVSVGLKMIAVISLICWLPFSLYMGALFFGLIFFVYDLGYNGQVKDKKDRLLIEFPDVIEVLEGYLSAGFDFVQAMEETVAFTNHWQPILKEMVVVTKYENLQSGLRIWSDATDIFEVKEFISILQLGIEQGLDMRSNIEHQASRIDELKDVAFEKKLAAREMMGVVVQGPLLIAILIAIMLPVMRDFMALGI